MLREDVIALNVLAEQVASEPAIREIEIYSMDGSSLASYSDDQAAIAFSTREFTRPIQLADATAGFVKVVVATQALETGATSYQAQEWLRLFGAALLSLLVMGGFIYWLTRTPSFATNIAELAAGEAGRQNQTSAYLLMVNLFNGNDMPAARRDALLASALRHTNAVASIYQGYVKQLSSTAIAVVFEQTSAPERSFEAACAALVLARLGNQPGGARYRYSLQQLRLDEGADPGDAIADSDRVDNALLHAALAEDNTVALAANFARALPRPERLELTSEHSPALRALHSFASEEVSENESNDYFLLSSANPTTQAMLEQQVKSLRAAQITPR